jgi:uncharacterized protein
MTTNRAVLIIGIIIIIVLGIWAFLNVMPFLGNLFGNTAGSVTINGQTFKADVADTGELQEKGLSGKKSLPEDRGMLFVFNAPDYHSFWMKEMQFPIDIIFINDDKVVTVYENVEPPDSENSPLPLYKPTIPADKVLEINGGLSKQYNIKNGDTVQLDL